MKIQPANYLRGTIKLPGDKSISHRAAIFSAMAEGETRIENFATSADCASTLECLKDLGIEMKRDGSTVYIKGAGKNGFSKPDKELDCGNSGTTMRLLTGVLAGQNFDSVLIGDESLSKRPMKRVIEPVTRMGAVVKAAENTAPLKIAGTNHLRSIDYTLPITSAQVKSCILLAGLNAEGKTVISNPASQIKIETSRNHTELMLQYLGADIEERFIEVENGFVQRISINGTSTLTAKNIEVPSDISSAAFFIIAAAALDGSEITIENVGLNPTRTAIIEVLKNFGAEVETLRLREANKELIGDLQIRGKTHFAECAGSNIIKGDVIAGLIDEIPILAVFGTQLENGLEIRDAAELRIKESDRIRSVVENLRRMQAEVEEFPDGFRVKRSRLKAARVDSFGDHRIAMAFAVAALFAQGETEIIDADCVKISFPDFFSILSELVRADPQ